MPSCSIKQCNVRFSKNQPNLSFHRIPENKVMRKKWLDAIGIENIIQHKRITICSLHFEESQFNRTLDVVRLRDDTIPTLFNERSTSRPNTQKESLGPSHEKPSEFEDMTDPHYVGNVVENVPNMQRSRQICTPSSGKDCNQLQRLQRIIVEQRKKIKCLREKIRRQGVKMSTLEDRLSEQKNNMNNNTEQSIVLEQCDGSQDVIKRQITFTREAFDTLKKMVAQSSPQKISYVLAVDETAIEKS